MPLSADYFSGFYSALIQVRFWPSPVTVHDVKVFNIYNVRRRKSTREIGVPVQSTWTYSQLSGNCSASANLLRRKDYKTFGHYVFIAVLLGSFKAEEANAEGQDDVFRSTI